MMQALTVNDLILTRLLERGRQCDLPVTAIFRSLESYLEPGTVAAEKRTQLATGIDQLLQEYWVERAGQNKLKLSASGRQHILQRLGLKESAQNLRWQVLSRVDLPLRALSLPAPDAAERRRFASADGLRAVVLRHAYALPLKAYPTLNQVRDSLIWYCLSQAQANPALSRDCAGRMSDAFTVNAIARVLFSNLLASTRTLAPLPALRQLAARAVGAQRTDIGEVRQAIVRQALQSAGTGQSATGEQALAEFAKHVIALARACQTGWFGDNKIFISHVWTEYHKQYPQTRVETFKQRLLQAHRQRLLQLARADLQQAMDPADVASSEIEYWGATFHFLRVD